MTSVNQRFEVKGNGNSEMENDVKTSFLNPKCDGDNNSDYKLQAKPNAEKNAFNNIDIEIEKPKALIYRVSENPRFYLTLLFAFQQALLSMASNLSIVLIVSEVACCQEDHELKIKLLSATMFMCGVSTFCMSTFGVRLPIFQGPSSPYLIPLIAMQYLEEWKCPATYTATDSLTNTTVLMANIKNGTDIPNRDVSLAIISKLSGSLMVAGAVHWIIGMTGLVGVLIRYIGPITIVPTIMLIGLKLDVIVVKFAQTDWTVAIFVASTNIILSLYLARCKTPLPWYSSQKGFYINWYPLHQVFSILLAMMAGWILAAILTAANYYTDDPTDKHFLARTDARSYTISQTNWFTFPYPGHFGFFSFSIGAFVNFMVATLSSVLDSIGDYAACARMARVSPPPSYAFNRGLAVEGLMSTLGGSLGCCHATVSYGGNIGAIGITKVASRRVFQVVGAIYILFAVVGKLGAVFITIPYSVLGGLTLVTMGIFIGMLLSYLQTVDLNSTRNLAIIGITLLVGFAIPRWTVMTPDGINTGFKDLDDVIKMMLSNPSFVGGIFSCFLDNTIPATLKERGLVAQMKDLDDEEAKELAKNYLDGPETYRLPFIPKSFRSSRIARIIPIFDLIDSDNSCTAKE